MDNPTQSAPFADMRSFLFLDPDAVRKYAKDLRATNTPENIEIADLLDATPDSVFQLNEKQKKLAALIQGLQQKNASEEIIRDFVHAMFALIYNRAIIRLSESMTGDIRAYWEEVMATNPNMFQIIALLNFYTKVAFSQEFDDYIDNIISEVVDEYNEVLQKEYETTVTLASLPKETLTEITKLFESGKVDEALVLMFSGKR